MYQVDRAGAARRADRLGRLAVALELLNVRIRAESQDVAVALALRARFGPSLPDIRITQQAIATQLARGVLSPLALTRLQAALSELASVLSYPLPETSAEAPSRPALRRAAFRAGRLDASAREILGAIAKAVAVGAAAAALYASPAAAVTCTGAPNDVCTGDLSAGGIFDTSPPVDTLTIKDLTKDITPASGTWAVLFAGQGSNGSDGAPWTTGDNGGPGNSVTLTVTDPNHKIVTKDQVAIIFGSSGGRGGDGGGAIVGHDAGNGGNGGDGGSVTGHVAIDITTSGDKAHGIVAISTGGGGGDGGIFLLGKASAGNGGRGGAGGAISLDFGPNSILTKDQSSDGIYAASLGGQGGHPGSCDVAICGTSGGGDSAVGGTVTVTTAAGSSIKTLSGFSDGIYASSVGGFGGDGSNSYLSLGFASNGGSAGDGGKVDITNRGAIQTQSGVSDAIFAQSIGGGGGNGGNSAITIVALGGGGAQGGNGGEVDVANASTGNIVTLGAYSRGVFAQSIGGGGGDGGAAIGLISVGGNGSSTSNGGLVHVENDGSIITKGAFSQDIYAQSIGGGGGDGGIAGGLVAVGGTAGGGGDGGKIEIINKGTADTLADQSFAILGMSVGGGGGNGGGTGGVVAVGGQGGDGGDGGAVTITSGGEVHTAGYHSKAIMGESVGGGGGLGGDATSVYAFINVSVGGSGGKGGDGKTVKITTDATSDLLTVGARSDGITAQSIGGGGGEGGYGAGGSAGAFGSVSIGVGGSGGDGGKGGKVEVTAAGSIVTQGVNSRGIFAESVGGGGGDGGFAVSAALAGGPVAGAGSVAVGGTGGKGGDSDTVTVTNAADISTLGDRSSAIYAQSVGGGGGAGGWSGAIAGAGGAVAGAVAVSVGGSGKGGGDGAAVTIGNTGDIHTAGVDAFGIFGQSVGGGGGTGGFSVAAAGAGGETAGGVGVSVGGAGAKGGDGKTVSLTTSGFVLTEGDRSAGVVAQSIGGGGGDGGFSGAVAVGAGGTSGGVAVGVGGSGGAGGDGGFVILASNSDVETKGQDAFAILAQSVGGGGGNGGFSLGAGVGAGGTSVGGSVNVGGSGGEGGSASKVELTSNGDVLTYGDRAFGIIAQSVGGGGGNGGFTGSVGVGAGGTGVGVAIGIGGSGGVAGDGGFVMLDSTSDVETHGVDAYGVLAQSVGGGGGNGGFSVAAAVGAGTTAVGAAVNIGGFGGAGGSAGEVQVSSSGQVITHDDRAIGVAAQSLGGGGGDGGFTGSVGVGAGGTGVGVAIGIGGFGGAAGDGGKVTLVSNGYVQTSGADAQGLFAQSVGGGGGQGGFSAGVAIGAGKTAAGASLTMGGFGGAAGDGGDVNLTSTKMVFTTGDRSSAIQAQSLGGGGGAGGVAANFSGAFGAGSPVSISLGMGGFGGAGGDAGDVTVVSTGGAATTGDDAHGVYAQSVGGGGGSGGFTVGGALSAGGTNSVALKASIGGHGGAAGDAGDVTVTADGFTHTTGDGSHGIFAQSIGGGGGDGGWAGSFSGSFGSSRSLALSTNLGGFGGDAGAAGDVTVISEGQVLTQGEGSHGVFAQSVGGGGGNGGMAINANVGATKAVNIGVSLGGIGGASGAAGTVTVVASNAIETDGGSSDGIFAQSVGGGGGNGGAAGALAFSSSDSINLTTSIGGFAGDGSAGGAVTVTNSGTILTLGELSNGIQAQSIGGGGGHGGMAGIDETGWSDYLAGGSASVSVGQRSQNISVSLGGFGGKGEDAGTVTVNNSGAIETQGVSSNVIDAESTGGGGGDGGVSTAASGAFGAAKNGTYAVAVGGSGGVAGNGGLVDVENSGSLLSLNAGSHGIYAASVGGGGGNGGQARGFSLSFSTKKKDKGAVSVSVSIGGQGGASGNGGEVKVDNSGQIVTDGPASFGIKAESIGGGGGDGGGVSTQGDEIVSTLDLINKGDAKGGQIAIGGSGGAAGDGGKVTVDNSGVIWTKGVFSHGIFAQSVGGGGGNGGDGLAGQVSVGGFGAAAGNGGEVDVTNSKFIEADGPMSNGIWAQSIGGGGGNGGATDYSGDTHYQYLQGLADTMNVADNLILTAEAAKSFAEPDWGIGIGGFGGAAGDGGTVNVTNTGTIVTKGLFGNGIFAQSVGGGGGTGGVGQLNSAGQIVFSGLGGSAGNGGDVTVVNKGVIETDGFGAYGIFAQSVGGGGGTAGNYALGIASWGNLKQFGGTDYSQLLQVGLNPVNGKGGNGGDVTVINTGDIILNGAGSQGIFAQSVGGGGGLFGGKLGLAFAGSMDGVGHGGKVTVIQNGNVIVTGKNSIGAFFQSASGDTDADIVATINGALTGGSVYGKALLVDGGKDNNITLNGLTMADSQLVIVATGGNDTINANAGVIGNVDLGTGNNAFNNGHTSTFLTLDYIKLNGGPLTNAGLITPGELGVVQVTEVTGDYVQTSQGSFDADLDLAKTGKAGENDRLNISGNISAQGGVVLNILNPGYALPGDHVTPIFAGGGTATSSNLALSAPVSAVAEFDLQTTAHAVNLHYGIDFSPTGLNANQTAIGDGINAIQLAGSSPSFAPIAAQLFGVQKASDLANIYDSFSPETYAVQAAILTVASQEFADSMMSCPTATAAVLTPDHGCIWVKPKENWLTLSHDASNLPFHEKTQGVAGGWEAALGADSWRVGGAASADHVNSDLSARTSSEGWRYQGGFVVKKSVDALTVDLAVHGASSSMQTRRIVLTPGGPLSARGTQKLSYLAGTVRASYRLGTDAAYLKPIVEASRLKVDTDGFTESGAGALDLVIPKQSDAFTRISAKLETGAEFASNGIGVRPYSRIGVSHLAGGDKDLFAAAFAGAPAGVQGFSVSPGLDRTTLDAEAGLALVGRFGSARLSWSGQFGDRTRSQTVALKFTKAFG